MEDGQQRLEVPEGQLAIAPLWGPQDAHRRLLERKLEVKLSARGEGVLVSGRPERVTFAIRVLENLLALIRKGAPIFLQDVEQAARLLEDDKGLKLETLRATPLLFTHERRAIVPKTPNQKTYIEAMQRDDVVFGIGPAGTGKTYLAMAAAVASLRKHAVKRIILTRPAVEAGEKLGFLPGTLTEKVNPYLRPLYDALFDLLGAEQANAWIESGTIEVAPLAFMRGRTLNRAFVILDEAQNTTREQMRMFLTRLGHGSQAVITGDATQNDLGPRTRSGLSHAANMLEGVKGISVARLTDADVVRHSLVQAIIQAYAADDARLAQHD